MTSRSIPNLDEDSRLLPILNNLSHGFIAGVPSEWSGGSGEAAGDEIKADMIDSLAPAHFPLCMRIMHESLRKDRHIKHYGRLNYGVFLKVPLSPPLLGASVNSSYRYTGARIVDRRSAGILEKVIQQVHRRRIHQTLQVQHPPFIRSRREAPELPSKEVSLSRTQACPLLVAHLTYLSAANNY